MLILRNVLFYLGFAGSAVLFGTLSVPLLALPYRFRAPIILGWISFVFYWLRRCCGTRIKLLGSLPPDEGPFVIMANHQSTLETLYLQRYIPKTATILKRQLLFLPFFGWGLAALRPIPIDRGSPVKALRKVKSMGQQRIAEDMNVLVFPEGTRRPTDQLGNFARSGADIAAAANVAVVPVAHNAGTLWPRHSWLKKAGTITMVMGPALDTENTNSKALTARVRSWIEGEKSRIDNGHYNNYDGGSSIDKLDARMAN